MVAAPEPFAVTMIKSVLGAGPAEPTTNPNATVQIKLSPMHDQSKQHQAQIMNQYCVASQLSASTPHQRANNANHINPHGLLFVMQCVGVMHIWMYQYTLQKGDE